MGEGEEHRGDQNPFDAGRLFHGPFPRRPGDAGRDPNRSLGAGLLHPESERMENEAVRHKILDLLGDLALLGFKLPRLRLCIRNGGHALNHLLLERLQHA